MPPSPPPRWTADTDLSALEIWPSAARQALAAAGIRTVGAVLGIVATAGGQAALAEHTGLAPDLLAGLLEATAAGLPAAERARLSRPAGTSRYGLGALPPAED